MLPMIFSTPRTSVTVFPVRLDISAMFNTVGYRLLPSRLENSVGLGKQVLGWVDSYFSSRYQDVSIPGFSSQSKPVACSVPQGSVPGPLFFTIYALPFGNIAQWFNLQFHLYVLHTQLCLSFNNNNPDAIQIATNTLESCISKFKCWMLENKLKLNRDKTKFIQISNSKKPTLQWFRIWTLDWIPTTPICPPQISVSLFDSNMFLYVLQFF